MSRETVPLQGRIYLTITPIGSGRVQLSLSRLPPTTHGALAALISRGVLIGDAMNMCLDLVSDPTQDDALKGKQGDKGNDGLSAYQIARNGGYGGTETQWIASLVGATGKSAYQLARDGGYGGTETQWLASLKATDGVSPTLSMGAVTTLPAGAAATASLTGTASSPKLNIGVPRGDKGDTGLSGATLIGSVTLAQTATVAIALGIREITMTLAGTVKGGRYLPFCDSYRLNGATAVVGRPAGYALIDAVCNTDGQITISLNAPLLAVGQSYALTCSVVRINT